VARKFMEVKFGCMAKAFDDEPVFVLLARDPAAAAAIRAWIAMRIGMGKNRSTDAQIQEAIGIAQMMEDEQAQWAEMRHKQKENACRR
jgi:hypothetical protein